MRSGRCHTPTETQLKPEALSEEQTSGSGAPWCPAGWSVDADWLVHGLTAAQPSRTGTVQQTADVHEKPPQSKPQTDFLKYDRAACAFRKSRGTADSSPRTFPIQRRPGRRAAARGEQSVGVSGDGLTLTDTHTDRHTHWRTHTPFYCPDHSLDWHQFNSRAITGEKCCLMSGDHVLHRDAPRGPSAASSISNYYTDKSQAAGNTHHFRLNV